LLSNPKIRSIALKILASPAVRIALLTAFLMAVMTSSHCPWEPLENAHYDLWAGYFRAPDEQPIEIVAIDQESLHRFGDWPWPRPRIAEIVRILSTHGAAAQGICLLYEHPDQNPGMLEIKQLREKASEQKCPGGKRTAELVDHLLAAAERDLNQDSDLITAVRRAKNVVLPIRFSSNGATVSGNETLPGLLVINSLNAETLPTDERNHAGVLGQIFAATPGALSSAQSVKQSFDDLAKKAGALGHVNIHEDPDGAVRRVPLLVDYNGRLFPALALQMAIKYLDGQLWDLKIGNDFFGEPQLNVKHLLLPTDRRYQMLLNLNREWTDKRTYTAAEILDGTIDPSIFKGKIVLLGLTDPETAQTYRVRSQVKASAVEIHANLLAGILSNVRLSRPPWARWLEMLAMLYFAFFLAFVLPRVNATIGGAILLIFMATWYGMGAILLVGYGYWVKVVAPVVLACLGFAILQWTSISRVRQNERLEANKALGLSYQGQGMLDMAYDKYMQCPVQDDTVKDLLYNLALDFERKRMFNRALSIYEHIRTDGPFKDIDKRSERLKPLDSAISLNAGGSRNEAPLMIDDTGIKPTFGRYEILQEIGRGSMGTVYLGRDPKINREVAIKTLAYAEVAPDELSEVKARFFREAESAGKLAHPNIVSIYDVGEEHDMAYIAMELLTGTDLTHHCKVGDLLPFDSVLDVIVDVTAAVAYAHAQGVVHRDIKPGNIMVLEDGRVKVTDFGIAHVMDASQTSEGVILGTPNYMSPEQVNGEPLDGRSDLFSLGVVFYELLSGAKPFKGDSISAILYAINHNAHTPLAEIAPEAPSCCERIVNRLLAKTADDRFATAGDLLEALTVCRADLIDAAPRIETPNTPPEP